MKRILIILLFIVSVSSYAETTLMNLGYGINTNWLGQETVVLHSIGLDIIMLEESKENNISLYQHINPYFGIGAIDTSTSQDILVKQKAFVGGLKGIIGYGTYIGQGSTGLMVGGGFLMDLNIKLGSEGSFYTSAGLGAGLNFLFTPTERSIILNAGLNLGWNPVSYWIMGGNLGSRPYAGQFIINFSLGIGW